MSYALFGLGQEWVPDPADCVDAGGVWDEVQGTCHYWEPRCERAGGVWDGQALTCTLPDGEVVDVKQWCLDKGDHWDEKHQICFIPYDEQTCDEDGGHWDAEAGHCLREPPGMRLTSQNVTAAMVIGGVVLLGLGLAVAGRRKR